MLLVNNMPDSKSAHIKIWIVEDNLDYCNDLIGYFEDEIEDIDCSAAFNNYESAEEALDNSSQAMPDAILMDIRLPGSSGIDAIPKVKAILPSVDIIMLTTFSDKRSVFDAICAGASGYLLKTDSIHDIARGIREVHGGGSSLNSQIAHMVLNMFSHLKPGEVEHTLVEIELEILRQLADGQQKKEIAANLELADHQINYNVRNIYKKLHVNSLSGAVGKAIRKGFI